MSFQQALTKTRGGFLSRQTIRNRRSAPNGGHDAIAHLRRDRLARPTLPRFDEGSTVVVGERLSVPVVKPEDGDEFVEQVASRLAVSLQREDAVAALREILVPDGCGELLRREMSGAALLRDECAEAGVHAVSF